jgi:hypothetical protein
MTYSSFTVAADELTLGKDGAQQFRAALSMPQLRELENALATQSRDQAGVRLSGVPELRPFLDPAGPVGQIPASLLGPACLPVRAILFDKSTEKNWSLGWHQDRTIAVKRRIDADGFGPWSIKSGMVHVEPPLDLLAGMVTVRVHLDAVPGDQWPAAHRARITQARADFCFRNSRCRSRMRNRRLPCRRSRYLAIRYACSSCVRSRGRPSAPSRAAGRLRQLPASRRVGMAGHLIHDRGRYLFMAGMFLKHQLCHAGASGWRRTGL